MGTWTLISIYESCVKRFVANQKLITPAHKGKSLYPLQATAHNLSSIYMQLFRIDKVQIWGKHNVSGIWFLDLMLKKYSLIGLGNLNPYFMNKPLKIFI